MELKAKLQAAMRLQVHMVHAVTAHMLSQHMFSSKSKHALQVSAYCSHELFNHEFHAEHTHTWSHKMQM